MLSDGTKGLTTAKNSEFPHYKRLMCWAHTIRKICENRKMIPTQKWNMVESDILSLQLSFNDHTFDKGATLLLSKWRADSDLLLLSNKCGLLI